MKSKTWVCVIALALVAALEMQLQLVAQDNKSQSEPKHHHYQVIDLGTFGGPNTNFFTLGQAAQILNNRGIATGAADTAMPDPNAPNCINSDCFITHAFQWQGGELTDLGALPGVNSSLGGWIATNGLVAGISGNSEIDPLTGGPEFRAVFWNDGQIIDLGTLGGNESLASAVNSRGQVVGSAANTIPDPFNTAPNLFGWGTQMHAFLWQNGAMQDLGTLGGPDSVAGLVNEAGQVAGFSYTSYTPTAIGVPPGHVFLWEKGKMHDLGTIGGTQVFQLNALNERGQVVGSMTLADENPDHVHPFLWDGEKLLNLGALGGDEGEADWLNDAGEVVGHAATPKFCPGGGTIDHAFLWRNGVMRDLGIVPDTNPLTAGSGATGINSKTQIVGVSGACDGSTSEAFLWEKGSMINLNTLIPSDSALYLIWAVQINDRGEITGFGVLPNGDLHTFLLSPCDGNNSGSNYQGSDDGSAIARTQRSSVVVPENVRRLIRQRMGSRYHVPGLGIPND